MRVAKPHLPPLEQHLALEITVHAGDDLHHGRFASAVLANEAMNLAVQDGEIHITQGGNAAKAFGNAFEFQQRRVAACVSGFGRTHSVGAPIRPRGRSLKEQRPDEVVAAKSSTLASPPLEDREASKV